MPKARISMEKVREIYRLKFAHQLSNRAIARALNISHPVVKEYLDKLQAAQVEPTAIDSMDDDRLEAVLEGDRKKPSPRCQTLHAQLEYIYAELKRPGVTLQRLWEEYRATDPAGYGYSQFCFHFQTWRNAQSITMHIEHKAGDKMFVDFTGKKLEILSRLTGEVTLVEIFVALLCASQLTYAEAVASQKKHDWIQANERALRYFGGVPAAIVPDCLKSAVKKANKYEPEINPDYAAFAQHYQTVILPARPNRPKDKALVEGAVRIVYQRIFAALRNQVFFSLAELNQAIAQQLEKHNAKPMQRMNASRKELFERIEKKELAPLPAELYTLRYFKRLKAQLNYHIYLNDDKHYYSVPYRYRGKTILLVYTDKVVEVFHKHQRIALHQREHGPGYTTVKDHMPSAHKAVCDWHPQRLIDWATRLGENVRKVVEQILAQKQHPEQGFKASLGVIRLADKYTKARLNKACQRAIELDYYSYRSLKNMLEKNLEDQQPDLFEALPEHENVRGTQYYQ